MAEHRSEVAPDDCMRVPPLACKCAETLSFNRLTPELFADMFFRFWWFRCQGTMWQVVKIMVPLLIPIALRPLMLSVPLKFCQPTIWGHPKRQILKPLALNPKPPAFILNPKPEFLNPKPTKTYSNPHPKS